MSLAILFPMPGHPVSGIAAGGPAGIGDFKRVIIHKAAAEVGTGGEAIAGTFAPALSDAELVGGLGVLVVEVVGALAGALTRCGPHPFAAVGVAAEPGTSAANFAVTARG
jgi:hypothetical protein